MNSAGYSKRPLADKLGLKPGMRAAILGAPAGYPALDAVTLVDPPAHPLDFAHLFVTHRADLDAAFPALKAALASSGMIWISWPKKANATKLHTDLDENLIREIGLALGMVDVKVAAVDETWSALKFVYRLKDR
jgi:hypothetical protein